jgi:hypothetical protein
VKKVATEESLKPFETVSPLPSSSRHRAKAAVLMRGETNFKLNQYRVLSGIDDERTHLLTPVVLTSSG